jgi:hypothetical protein
MVSSVTEQHSTIGVPSVTKNIVHLVSRSGYELIHATVCCKSYLVGLTTQNIVQYHTLFEPEQNTRFAAHGKFPCSAWGEGEIVCENSLPRS